MSGAQGAQPKGSFTATTYHTRSTQPKGSSTRAAISPSSTASSWWKRNHNAHHIACNSLDHDPDLQHLPLFAVSSNFYQRTLQFDPLAKVLVSYQHLTFYPIMVVDIL